MQTFDEAKTAFSKAKVKSTGRPLEGRTTRLLQKGDCFVVRYQETDVVCYKPDVVTHKFTTPVYRSIKGLDFNATTAFSYIESLLRRTKIKESCDFTK